MTNSENKKVILLIDALNTFFRSYAVDPSISSKGEHIGGCKGFLKQINKFCREMAPDEIHVVWDGEGGSKKRKTMKKDYKEGRKAVNPKNYNRNIEIPQTDEEIKENKVWQLKRLMEYLNETPIKQYLVDNVEADDIIAMLSNKYFKGYNKVIISNDKDFLQLADHETIVYRPAVKGVMTRDDIIEKYEVHPENMALSRAIIGDSSDNLPGVPGIGFKTLVKVLPSISGSATMMLEDVMNAMTEVEDKDRLKAHNSILEHKDRIDLNYRMMQLYNPKMGHATVRIVEQVVEEELYNYSRFELEKMMIEDGFGEYNWNAMHARFRGMLYDQKNED
jgi:DNA polymerase-1